MTVILSENYWKFLFLDVTVPTKNFPKKICSQNIIVFQWNICFRIFKIAHLWIFQFFLPFVEVIKFPNQFHSSTLMEFLITESSTKNN